MWYVTSVSQGHAASDVATTLCSNPRDTDLNIHGRANHKCRLFLSASFILSGLLFYYYTL